MTIPSDRIGFKSKRVFISANLMTGVLSTAGVNAQQGAGGAVHAAHSVGGSELAITKIGADGDEFYHFFPIPWDFNRNYDFRFRPIYSDSTTSGVATTWKFKYVGIAEGEAIADIPAGAEELSISNTNSSTANALEIPDWTTVASGTVYVTASDYAILLRLECDTMGTGMSADELELFGVEIEYIVEATRTIRQQYGTYDTTV